MFDDVRNREYNTDLAGTFPEYCTLYRDHRQTLPPAPPVLPCLTPGTTGPSACATRGPLHLSQPGLEQGPGSSAYQSNWTTEVRSFDG